MQYILQASWELRWLWAGMEESPRPGGHPPLQGGITDRGTGVCCKLVTPSSGCLWQPPSPSRGNFANAAACGRYRRGGISAAAPLPQTKCGGNGKCGKVEAFKKEKDRSSTCPSFFILLRLPRAGRFSPLYASLSAALCGHFRPWQAHSSYPSANCGGYRPYPPNSPLPSPQDRQRPER